MKRGYSNAELFGAGIGSLLYVTVIGALIVGWVMNIMTLWHTMDSPITAKFILRVVGIFVGPLGGILGYL